MNYLDNAKDWKFIWYAVSDALAAKFKSLGEKPLRAITDDGSVPIFMNDKPICYVRSQIERNRKTPIEIEDPERDAYAFLIASSPALYHELVKSNELLSDLLLRFRSMGVNDIELEPIISQIDCNVAAIKKAKGEQI
ncbi:MAG: hypothetical protein M0D57_02925 [Sphingobacteriales bacterium JAD_PAG50586_3]|nr:MAG: hypothetical protein M0D57_02925 [Sphingobacteriales bacterium JAD_PAG50586_3]